MSKVIVVGAHGKVALLTLPRLVAAGHEVTGVIRRPSRPRTYGGPAPRPS